jgi:S1-C subfamily serine protease
MKQFAIPLLAAILGGGITAGALLGAGVVDGGDTTTIVRQAPLSAASAMPARTTGDLQALTAADIYKLRAPGVVFIRAHIVQVAEPSPFDLFPQRDEGISTGSGFVIDDRGHVLTNAHVVDSATDVHITFSDKRTVAATIVGKDPDTDLALLHVDPAKAHLQPLDLGDSSTVEVGDPTVAIGNPFGLDRTLTTGVVSALQRRIEAPSGFAIEDVIQTDAAINPGNSGGPLMDAEGRVIGINSQIATAAGSTGSVGIGFAVPVNTAKVVIPQLKKTGRVQRVWLGVQGRTIDESLASLDLPVDHGVLVESVNPGTPAAAAGLQGGGEQAMVNGEAVKVGGDIVDAMDGKPIRSMEELVAELGRRRPGDVVELAVLRDGKSTIVRCRLAERPARAIQP